MRKSRLIVLFMCLLALQSCGVSYVASYSVGLSSVESPADAKQQFGETKVVSFNEEGLTKFQYEDDFIDIIWFVDSKQFNFTLKNKTQYSMKICWDDISYVDIDGQSGRVMHAGVKYNERNNSQPSTTIPRGASISDLLLPTNNVSYISGGYGGWWSETLLIPSVYPTQEAYDLKAESYVGKTMSIMMPVVIQNVQNDYIFTFNIDALLPRK